MRNALQHLARPAEPCQLRGGARDVRQPNVVEVAANQAVRRPTGTS